MVGIRTDASTSFLPNQPAAAGEASARNRRDLIPDCDDFDVTCDLPPRLHNKVANSFQNKIGPRDPRAVAGPAARVASSMSHHKVYEKRPFDPELEPISQSSPWSSQDASHRRRQCGGWHVLEKRLTVVVICLAYTIVGPTVIVVNNHIIKALHFPYPLLLSCVGLFTTASACAFKVRVWPWLRDCCHPKRYDDDLQQQDAEAADPLLVDRASAPASDSGLTGVRGGGVGGGGGGVSAIQPMTRRFWLYNMVPIGIAQGLTFACGNAAYMYLTITFTQMLSAFTPSVTLLLLYLSGVEIPTIRATCAVLVICVGCLISSYGEVNFDPTGVTFRCIGILMEAIRLGPH